jgi:hypothetical protein
LASKFGGKCTAKSEQDLQLNKVLLLLFQMDRPPGITQLLLSMANEASALC